MVPGLDKLLFWGFVFVVGAFSIRLLRDYHSDIGAVTKAEFYAFDFILILYGTIAFVLGVLVATLSHHVFRAGERVLCCQ